jgi:hypothetical protein
MGYKFEVSNWEYVKYYDEDDYKNYTWKIYYTGNSVFKALYYFLKLKLKGSTCFKLTWRK